MQNTGQMKKLRGENVVKNPPFTPKCSIDVMSGAGGRIAVIIFYLRYPTTPNFFGTFDLSPESNLPL